MKLVTRIRFFAAMAGMAILLAGCEKDIDNDKSAGYGPVAAKITSTIRDMSTRAAGTSWSIGDSIGISGKSDTVDYVNVKYMATSANGKFEVKNVGLEDNAIYFQDGKAVAFTAYYPYTGTSGNAPGVLTRTLTAADQTLQKQPGIDFMFASGTGTAAAPEVNFVFSHCMSRLVLCFFAGNDVALLSDLTYTLSGLRWQGTFNTATGEARADLSVQPADIAIQVPQATEMTSPLIVFPGQGDNSQPLNLVVTMNGRIYKGAFTPDKQGGVMLGGNSYICNVTLNKSTLTVEAASIEPWQSVANPNIEATN